MIASFAKTEDAANGMTSAVQFPLMFLSGMFFPIEAMPDALQTVARFLPLTYLGDALRQVMVGGTPFAPLWSASRSSSSGWSSASASPRAASGGSRPAREAGWRYQRSSWTISARARRPPARLRPVRSPGSAG